MAFVSGCINIRAVILKMGTKKYGQSQKYLFSPNLKHVP